MNYTGIVTEINGHRDMGLRNSHIKMVKRFKQQYHGQTKCHGKHCLSLFYYLVCEILLFTVHYLNLKTLKTVYLCDCLS